MLVNHDLNSINDEDEDSNTALHLASLAGHNKVVTVLLETGADIEARSVFEEVISLILIPETSMVNMC